MGNCARRASESETATAEREALSRPPPSETATAVEPQRRRVLRSWARLLRKYWGIKRQQWIFHSTGEALKMVNEAARERLSKTYKIEGKAREAARHTRH